MSDEGSRPRFKLMGAPALADDGRFGRYVWWIGYAGAICWLQLLHYLAVETAMKIEKRCSVGALIAGWITVFWHFVAGAGGGSRRARFGFFVRSRLVSLPGARHRLAGIGAEKTPYPSFETRDRVRSRDGHTCTVCGATGGSHGTAELHVDHIVPRSWGGANEDRNLRTLCRRCHGLRHLTAFRD